MCVERGEQRARRVGWWPGLTRVGGCGYQCGGREYGQDEQAHDNSPETEYLLSYDSRTTRPASSPGRAAVKAGSVPERLREPPGTAVVGDLRVDHQRFAAGTREPLAHREQVLGGPDRHPRAAEAAADRGEVGVGEADRGHVRVAEVVDLRAVGGVVVHDHHQR